jgi:hypothetical protein
MADSAEAASTVAFPEDEQEHGRGHVGLSFCGPSREG